MNTIRTRRTFLAEIGMGTLAATVGPDLASAIGIGPPDSAEAGPERLEFGELEPLVRYMQETPVDRLQAGLVAKRNDGVPLRRMLAAGALANARAFGGEDYTGFHTMMALGPAMRMADSMPEPVQALPVFKVLYRNTARIHERGEPDHEVLHRVASAPGSAESLHAAVLAKDAAKAERIFAALCGESPEAGMDAVLRCVQEDTEVHRTVLPYRAWDLLEIVGREHAHTLLRQSLRYCLRAESWRQPEWDRHGRVLTTLLDEHRLAGRTPGTRQAQDAFIAELADTIFRGSPEEAAGAVAAALAEGYDPAAVGEAVSLAANQLVLRDQGRTIEGESPGKPVGSVHGDSIGVHASDSANAWRNLARVSSGRNVFACLILGAWQAALDRVNRGGDFLHWEPVPTPALLAGIRDRDPAKLLGDLDAAIRQNLQGRATAITRVYGELGYPEQDVFSVLLRYAISEDGSLHAEKYYQTVCDEFRTTRPAYRWRHLIALARVTASEFGRPAPGLAEARKLLNC